MRLVQLLGDGIEELWEFVDDVTDEQIIEMYARYELSGAESFEEWIESNTIEGIRVFVNEIYV